MGEEKRIDGCLVAFSIIWTPLCILLIYLLYYYELLLPMIFQISALIATAILVVIIPLLILRAEAVREGIGRRQLINRSLGSITGSLTLFFLPLFIASHFPGLGYWISSHLWFVSSWTFDQLMQPKVQGLLGAIVSIITIITSGFSMLRWLAKKQHS